MSDRMSDEEFEEALKTFPCPACSQIGQIKPHYMKIVATYKGGTLTVEGEGTACSACGTKTMTDEMTEALVNQKSRLDGVTSTYLEVSPESGGFKTHYLN